MRRKWKKLLSTTLALAMVVTTIGVREVPVSAAEEENTNESVVYMDNMAYDTTTGHFQKLSSVGTYEQVNAEAKESGGYMPVFLQQKRMRQLQRFQVQEQQLHHLILDLQEMQRTFRNGCGQMEAK